ncbi:hypothetical protein SteCoe_1705 [Stentor coeruleus]|uniref:Uncharacterized protein n=1 Tax=Stentor coeruleus TaxID=5963 RepID=A0A1R2D182_9CILI|nr:hypothetical protein SteCoe_1705 [Stentor coeruleus]
MSSLDLRNQRLAELREQKLKGMRKIPLYSESFKPDESLRSNELSRAEIPPERIPLLSAPKNEATKNPFGSLSTSNPDPAQTIETVSSPAPCHLSPEVKTLETTTTKETVFLPPKQDQPQKSPQLNKYQEQIFLLKQQIQSKKLSISALSKTILSSQQEKLIIQNEVKKIILNKNLLIKTLSSKRIEYESSISSFLNTLHSIPNEENQIEITFKLNDLKKSIEAAKISLQKKEEQSKTLKEDLQEVISENRMANGALPTTIPEPYDESLQSDLCIPYQRNLVSDMGSTIGLGGFSNQPLPNSSPTIIKTKQSEESKGMYYPSPDPHENILHQSTGETLHILHESDQGAATPPNDLQWGDNQEILIQNSLEEAKEPGTPKRDGSIRRNSSGSSTPHRYTDSIHRVHNLLGPSIHSYNSEEDGDFFNTLTRDKRRTETNSRSLFD